MENVLGLIKEVCRINVPCLLIGTREYKPQTFLVSPCSFVRVALTKNPKKRPPAERMLHQPFVLAGDLNIGLSRELLARVRNPESYAMGSSSGSGRASGGVAGALHGPAYQGKHYYLYSVSSEL